MPKDKINLVVNRQNTRDANAADFERHASKWKAETMHWSSVSRRVLHPSYLHIIALGRKALPLILQELKKRPDHWLVALNAITEEDPASDGATFREAVDAWIRWGNESVHVTAAIGINYKKSLSVLTKQEERMQTVILKKAVKVWQWEGNANIKHLPENIFPCQPEVHYSADRKYVYFTYANLQCRHWIGTQELNTPPEANAISSAMKTTRADGSVYYREVLPFSLWSIKSEASVVNDYSAKMLNRNDISEMSAFLDYVHWEGWAKTEDEALELPPRVEYRQIDKTLGRGYRPYYIKPTDWLVIDKESILVLTDEEYKKLITE